MTIAFLVYCERSGNFFFVMGVFMLAIMVKSNDLFSPLDSSSPVIPFVLSVYRHTFSTVSHLPQFPTIYEYVCSSIQLKLNWGLDTSSYFPWLPLPAWIGDHEFVFGGNSFVASIISIKLYLHRHIHPSFMTALRVSVLGMTSAILIGMRRITGRRCSGNRSAPI